MSIAVAKGEGKQGVRVGRDLLVMVDSFLNDSFLSCADITYLQKIIIILIIVF